MKFWKLNEPILLFLLACICLAVTGFLFSAKIGLLIISIELFVIAFISYERGEAECYSIPRNATGHKIISIREFFRGLAICHLIVELVLLETLMC